MVIQQFRGTPSTVVPRCAFATAQVCATPGVLDLLDMPYPGDASAHPETGELVLEGEGWRQLSSLFATFGLQLKKGACAAAVKAAWCELVESYAPSVRMFASIQSVRQQRIDLDALSFTQHSYARSVAKGNRRATVMLARVLFNRPQLRQFLVLDF